MNLFFNTLAQALQALGDHRLRTVLSILGITIGISAVMIVSTISRGGNHMVFSELETFGLNSVWVSRDWNADVPNSVRLEGSGIKTDDLTIIETESKALGIRRLTPQVWVNRNRHEVRRGDQTLRADILGVSSDYLSIVNDNVVNGRGLMQHDIDKRHSVVVLAPRAANTLFPRGENPVGKLINVGTQRFNVVGVLGNKSRDFLASIGSSGGQDANVRVLMPYPIAQRFRGDNSIDTLQIEVQNFSDAEQVGAAVKQKLEKRRPGYVYNVETMAGYIKTTNNILGGVALVGVVAASISLLVGGMGIMNMMGTSVLERTREIGIRKALGARERDILVQFLLEAGLISIMGGLLGLLLGGLVSVGLAYAIGFPLIPSYQSIIVALLVSIIVGMLSGIMPARRAARMHPVEALRTD